KASEAAIAAWTASTSAGSCAPAASSRSMAARRSSAFFNREEYSSRGTFLVAIFFAAIFEKLRKRFPDHHAPGSEDSVVKWIAMDDLVPEGRPVLHDKLGDAPVPRREDGGDGTQRFLGL